MRCRAIEMHTGFSHFCHCFLISSKVCAIACTFTRTYMCSTRNWAQHKVIEWKLHMRREARERRREHVFIRVALSFAISLCFRFIIKESKSRTRQSESEIGNAVDTYELALILITNTVHDIQHIYSHICYVGNNATESKLCIVSMSTKKTPSVKREKHWQRRWMQRFAVALCRFFMIILYTLSTLVSFSTWKTTEKWLDSNVRATHIDNEFYVA